MKIIARKLSYSSHLGVNDRARFCLRSHHLSMTESYIIFQRSGKYELRCSLVLRDLWIFLLFIVIFNLVRHVEILVADTKVCEKIVFAYNPVYIYFEGSRNVVGEPTKKRTK